MYMYVIKFYSFKQRNDSDCLIVYKFKKIYVYINIIVFLSNKGFDKSNGILHQ